LIYCKISKFTW